MLSLEPCDSMMRPLNKISPPDQYKEEIEKYETEVKHWLDFINRNDLQNSLQANPNEVEAETEEVFDIDDIYTNDKIKPEVWESYITYLKHLSNYLNQGSKLGMVGE